MSRGLPTKLVDLSGLPTEAPEPSPEQRVMFLEAVLRGASLHTAAGAAGLAYTSFFRLKLRDAVFAAELEAAIDLRKLSLEEIAIKYAVEGVPMRETRRTVKPIVVDGDLLESVEETTLESNTFSPHALLQFLLRGQMREKYGTEHSKRDLSVTPGAPPALRTNEDAMRVLKKLREDLRPSIEGTATEVKTEDDGSDLV